MKINNLGKMSYEQAYQVQLDTVAKVINGESEDTLIICSHDPVVTLGKKSSEADICGWNGETVSIERGGKATYHGPGQVVIYPIINLKNKGQNIAGFLQAMEDAMVEVLKEYGIEGAGNPNRGEPDYTGVWVGQKKIASIGVAVKRWVTYHGLAFNLEEDPMAFQGINPCGFSTDTMTSLQKVLMEKSSESVNRSDFENMLSKILIQKFSEL
ncbi:MAG: lipoyl(octanoyl) transferase LipB [Oligoflexia bacterium]|nr:lipoyl(octanoyl) transferase LipB [Oligoflexia bacterium]